MKTKSDLRAAAKELIAAIRMYVDTDDERILFGNVHEAIDRCVDAIMGQPTTQRRFERSKLHDAFEKFIATVETYSDDDDLADIIAAMGRCVAAVEGRLDS